MNIYISMKPNNLGGPHIFVKNFYSFCTNSEHNITRNIDEANTTLWIIAGADDKTYKKIKARNIKYVGRIGGCAVRDYFHNKVGKGLADREFTYDHKMLNKRLSYDIQTWQHVVYQSKWAKQMQDENTHRRDFGYSIIYNPVDCELFKPRENYTDTNDEIIIGCAGAIRHDYLLNNFFRVIHNVKKNSNKVIKCLIIGNVDKISKSIIQSNSKINVEMVGHVEHDNLPNHLKRMDIFLHCRQGDACPNVIAEALACGTPVVCGSWGGQSELIDENCGHIAQVDKWDYTENFSNSLTEGIIKIIKDMDKFKFKAREKAINVYNFNLIFSKYINILK